MSFVICWYGDHTRQSVGSNALHNGRVRSFPVRTAMPGSRQIYRKQVIYYSVIQHMVVVSCVYWPLKVWGTAMGSALMPDSTTTCNPLPDHRASSLHSVFVSPTIDPRLPHQDSLTGARPNTAKCLQGSLPPSRLLLGCADHFVLYLILWCRKIVLCLIKLLFFTGILPYFVLYLICCMKLTAEIQSWPSDFWCR